MPAPSSRSMRYSPIMAPGFSAASSSEKASSGSSAPPCSGQVTTSSG
ncbi:hypothetical protein SCE1572_20025 [Sorangium cellulosum So0157-2]|uniref:Uncharacterized protein n=1 Tax=Sorangium cellulosum So0157-2 TaxID=1254432 RepID=S4XVR3_SORCE|nr:hypothetical protein SCE1572_20025 [Sorangium cellulosum So0157-2]